MLSKKEVEKIYEKARATVRVSCDDFHAHSAINGCLDGDEKSIDICKLVETIHRMEYLLNKFLKEYYDSGWGKDIED